MCAVCFNSEVPLNVFNEITPDRNLSMFLGRILTGSCARDEFNDKVQALMFLLFVVEATNQIFKSISTWLLGKDHLLHFLENSERCTFVRVSVGERSTSTLVRGTGDR